MITNEQVQDQIATVEYHHFRGTTMTVCCLKLQSGYTVIGKSAAADPAEFDITLGQKFAREDAEARIYELLAFVQCEKRAVTA